MFSCFGNAQNMGDLALESFENLRFCVGIVCFKSAPKMGEIDEETGSGVGRAGRGSTKL